MKVTFTTSDLGDVRLLANAGRYKQVLWEFRESLFQDDTENSQLMIARLSNLLDEYGLTLEDDYEPTEESGCSCGRASGPNGNGGES